MAEHGPCHRIGSKMPGHPTGHRKFSNLEPTRDSKNCDHSLRTGQEKPRQLSFPPSYPSYQSYQSYQSYLSYDSH
jgi:hypothetical protein